MSKINIAGHTFGFDYKNENRSEADYATFARLADQLEFVRSGEEGGSHGTEQGTYIYRLSPDLVVVKVLPGALRKGFLRLEEQSQAVESAYDQMLADDEAAAEQAQREYRAAL